MTSNDYKESLLSSSSGNLNSKSNYKSLENNNSSSYNITTNPVQQQNQNQNQSEMANKFIIATGNGDNKMEEDYDYEYKLDQNQHSINSGGNHQYHDSSAALISAQHSEEQLIQKQSTGYSYK